MAALTKRSVDYAIPIAQATTEANMRSRVHITRTTESSGAFDRTTGRPAAPSSTDIYEGPARIFKVTGGGAYELGEEQQFPSQTYVAIPMSAPRPQIKDEITVLEDDDDELVDRRFKIDDVEVGGMVPAERRMAVSGLEPAPNTVTP